MLRVIRPCALLYVPVSGVADPRHVKFGMANQVSVHDAPALTPHPVQCPKCSAIAGIAITVEAAPADPKARRISVVCQSCDHRWLVQFHVSD
jgi:hypothetical protein